MTATISDPTGARVIVVAALSQQALDANVQDVLLYRLDQCSGGVAAGSPEGLRLRILRALRDASPERVETEEST